MNIADKLLMIAENEQRVHEAGKRAEYKAFWEANQEGGNRAHYANAYSYLGWDDTNFNPIYNIAPRTSNGISNMFNYNQKITNTKVNIIVNGCSARQAFANCVSLQRIPYIEFNNCTDLYNAFLACNSLSYIRVGGVIDRSINFSSCPLDLESAKSVIMHLKQMGELDEQYTQTVYFSEYTWGLLNNDEEGPDSTFITWREYISDILYWNC